ncbi:MAG: hypothetical protein A2868_02690 [Candidatus Levybacteria bacterium RIFCSPHIGHO2_01_FULL_40_15b]|nr:MAG: hypothetical protein A2868_02690 [Candidatus Levybacteria bacterium RIFCSPHIGHO2_01_FULL_40_15b]
MTRQEVGANEFDHQFRTDFSPTSFDEEDGLFHDFLPFSDISGWVPEGGIYEDVLRNTTLVRLGDIHALSFLSYVGPPPEHQYFLDFPHDRLDHSWVVAMTGQRILERNGFSKTRVDKAVMAFLLHDVGTPALGDATMQVDPENLAEEEYWSEAAFKEGGREILEKYGTDELEIDSIIKNRGVLGQVLDIADRITYTMKDLYSIISYGQTGRNEYTRDLYEVLDKFPDIGNVYKDVRIEGDRVYFTNPERLKAFLLLRAHLHQKLYLNPISQGRDFLVRRLIEDAYSASGDPVKPLNPQNLREMGDEELQRILFEWHKPQGDQAPYFLDSRGFFMGIVNWHPEYRQFESEEEAIAFQEKISEDPNNIVLGVKKRSGFDPGTSYLVRDPQTGDILPLHDYDPEGSVRIEEIAESLPGIFVYYKDVSKTDERRGQAVNTLLSYAFAKS